MRGKILLVDDDQMILRGWEMLLSQSYDVTTASTVTDAKAILESFECDVAVVDLDFAGQELDGLDLIHFIQTNFPLLPIFVLSGDTATSRIRDAMRTNIVDFIVKNSEADEALLLAIKRGLQKRQAQSVDRRMFQTRSPKMQRMLSVLERIVDSRSDSPILILGEAGTGKEHTARHIGAASRKKVVTTNMANHRAEMADAALFGHLKGSFTGADQTRSGLVEQAHNGILFLDEIGETPIDVQAKLLRVIQEKEFNMVGSPTTRKVDLRFIAATNRDLAQMSSDGSFRVDLLERLSTWVLRIPALRERPEDVVFLTNEFVNFFTLNGRPFRIEQDGLDELLSYQWPGNVRELRNVVERITTMSDSGVLDRESVRYGISQDLNAGAPTLKNITQTESAKLTKDDYMRAMEHAQGNRTKAAKLLNIHRATLYRKLRSWHLVDATVPDETSGALGGSA